MDFQGFILFEAYLLENYLLFTEWTSALAYAVEVADSSEVSLLVYYACKKTNDSIMNSIY